MHIHTLVCIQSVRPYQKTLQETLASILHSLLSCVPETILPLFGYFLGLDYKSLDILGVFEYTMLGNTIILRFLEFFFHILIIVFYCNIASV